MAEQASLLRMLKSNRTTIKKMYTKIRTYLTALNEPATTIIELCQWLQRFVGIWDSFNETQSGIEAIEWSRLRKKYSEFIHEYENLQHMRELRRCHPSWDVRLHFYLPHHCVIKETSVTTKLRVVFDALSKIMSGIPHNDVLMIGLVLQQDLFSILLRFRSFEYALIADIAKMYRQVLLGA